MTIKPLQTLYWVASSKKDLLAMPKDVQDVFGYALHLAQIGQKHPSAKPLKGFGGAGILEVVEDFRGECIPRCLHGSIQGFSVCSALLPEEIKAGD